MVKNVVKYYRIAAVQINLYCQAKALRVNKKEATAKQCFSVDRALFPDCRQACITVDSETNKKLIAEKQFSVHLWQMKRL